ncbi:hypothetical protein ACFL0H_11550 [Thermodesulfobacteriota bacterium]
MAVLLAVMGLQNRKISVWLIFLVLIAFITASLYAFWWNTGLIYFYTANICVALLVASVASNRELDKTVSVGSAIVLIIVLGAWIAFYLKLSGVGPATIFVTAGGREIPFYYTALAHDLWTPFGADMVRVSGIYDEPGTLSFVICLFAFFRHTKGMNKRFTWTILLLGFVTFSLAHLIYSFIHFISELSSRKKVLQIFFLGIVGIAVLSQTVIFQYIDYALVARLSISGDSDKIVQGDNRSNRFFQDWSNLKDADLKGLVFGYGDSSVNKSQGKEDVVSAGENPLVFLVSLGIFASWPYYLFLLFAIGVGATNKNYLPLLGVGLLFMQRPAVMRSGYAMLAAMTIIIVLRDPAIKRIYRKLVPRH